MKQTRRSMFISMVLVTMLFTLFGSFVVDAAPQTLTILGAQGTQGQTDAYTEFSQDGGVTWNKAYLSGWHPWGFLPDTNSWLNCSPNGQDCLYQSILYRVRFNVPKGFSNPQMKFEVKADNYATIWLNGTYVTDVVGENHVDSDAVINSALVPGMNEIRLLVRDEGGWAGFNYKITINMEAPTPPVIVGGDTIAPTATVGYSQTVPTNQNVVATITPSEPVTITNNGGSASHTFSENGSFTFEFVDAAGNVGSTVATVSNIDKTAPTAVVSYSTVSATNQNVVATITPSEPVTITNNGGSASHTFSENGSNTFEFVDAAGNVGSAVATVSNIDKTAPTLKIQANTNSLWSPNHKLVDIRFSWDAQDIGSGIARVKLLSVTSNEPDNGLGDGDTANDIQGADYGTADDMIQLRAERSGTGTGRVYTITYEAVDIAGNSVIATATVTVPHSAKK